MPKLAVELTTEMLLQLLDDAVVQARLRAIVLQGSETKDHPSQEDLDSLEQQVSPQQKKINELQEKNMTLKALYEKLKRCLAQEKQKTQQTEGVLHAEQQQKEKLTQTIKRVKGQHDKLEKEHHVIKAELQDYQHSFSELQAIYTLFTSLKPNTRSSIGGIFKDDSLQGFIAAGVQERNIDSLWEYIKHQIIEECNEDTATLIEMFNFLFCLYAKAYPQMQQQAISIGESFDPSKHINTSHSAVSGAITAVVLDGWINTKTKKIIKQAVVRL